MDFERFVFGRSGHIESRMKVTGTFPGGHEKKNCKENEQADFFFKRVRGKKEEEVNKRQNPRCELRAQRATRDVTTNDKDS